MRYLVLCGVCLLFGCADDGGGAAGDGTDSGSSSAGETSASATSVASSAQTTAVDPDSTEGLTEGSDTVMEGSAGSGSTTTGPNVCDIPADARISGRIWRDADNSDASTYIAEFVDGTDVPREGDIVQLLGPGGTTEATTCDDGRYGFAPADDGTYLVAPPTVDFDLCMQRNCPRRLPVAIAEGSVKIVTIGDSVPLEGDPVPFPGRVADMLSPLAAVEDVNAAVSGSTSPQWVPGAAYWESNVVANLDDADVLVLSIGGNDFLALLQGADLSNIVQVLADAEQLVVDVTQNVREISAAARAIQPDLDVVYCLYPDYSTATQTPPWSTAALLPAGTIYNLLAQARDLISPVDEIIVVDLLEASLMLDRPLDDFLADALHFNDAGHQFYAEEIFKTLGGVDLGEPPLGTVHNFSMQPLR